MRQGTDWIHWVESRYYSIPSFIRESRAWGVSRGIKPQVLKRMAWGDRIYLVAREKELRAPVIFGYFHLERIQGVRLDKETRARMEAETGKRIRVVSSETSLLVERGCGYCVNGGLYLTTEASVRELANYGEAEGPEIRGKLVIFPKPYPALRNLRPFHGFRPFDGEGFRRNLLDGR